MPRLADLLDEAHQRFRAAPLCYGQSTDNAWDEAVALVLGVTGLPDERSSLDAPVGAEAAARIRRLTERRVEERQPLAYLLGQAPYCGELFHLSPGIVIPRSPIGPLLMDGLPPWVDAPRRILDLCCGSGCLGLIAAKRFPDSDVVLADIDPTAVATARRNVREHGLESRALVVCSDLFAGLPQASGTPGSPQVAPTPGQPQAALAPGLPQASGTSGLPQTEGTASGDLEPFDLILCNPPYADAESMATCPPEFAHEPTLGLAGGEDGLAIMNRVLAEASAHLTENGVLIGEVGQGDDRLEQRWPNLPFFWPDLPAGGRGVFLLARHDLESCQAQ